MPYPLKVRVPDIPYPHPEQKRVTKLLLDYWEKERGKSITIDVPVKAETLNIEPGNRCDSEYFWPVIEDNGKQLKPSVTYYACCHVIEID